MRSTSCVRSARSSAWAPPTATTAIPSAARSRPRRAAGLATAIRSLSPSTKSTAFGLLPSTGIPGVYVWSSADRRLDSSAMPLPAQGPTFDDRWAEGPARDADELTQLVYLSNLIGQEPRLVQPGGGNTSIKVGDALLVK